MVVAVGAVAVLTVAFNVVLDRSLNADANSRARSLAAAAAATVSDQNGRLRVQETAGDAILDRRVWVYEGTRAIERPPATADLQRTADALAGSAHVFDDMPDGDVRLYAAPVTVGGPGRDRRGCAVAGAYTHHRPGVARSLAGRGAAGRGGRPDVDHGLAR